MHLARPLRVLTVAMASLALLAGCSGTGDDGTSEDGSAALTVWLPTQEDAQKEAMTGLIDAFEQANPDITVTTEERSVDAHKEALRQAVGTETGPDVYWYWEGAGLGGSLVDAGMSLDLSDYAEQYGWADRFTSAAWASATQYGGVSSVPWTQQSQGIYYNKELFAQAGISEAPTSYAELVDAARALKDAGITPISFGGTVNWHVMRLLDALVETECGVETADSLNTGDGDWGSEQCVGDAFTELKSWGDNYMNQGFMGVSNDDASALFWSGQSAMQFEGSWFNAQLVDNGMDAENVGIFAFPTGTGRLYGFGEGYYITKSSKNPDAAAEFLDFITSTDGQEIAGSAWAALSTNKDVPVSADNPLNQVWVDLSNAATGVYSNNDQNFSTAETTEYWRIQNSVLTGDIAPADAGAEFQKFRDQQ